MLAGDRAGDDALGQRQRLRPRERPAGDQALGRGLRPAHAGRPGRGRPGDRPGDRRPLRPSVDLPHHLFLYRHLPEVGGIIHTHSNYATAFAAVGRPIPLCLTAIADEFGDEIPCCPYVDNEGDHIGEAILKHRNRAPAILLANHGVFAWGPSARRPSRPP